MNPSYPGGWSSGPVILCSICVADPQLLPGQTKAAVTILQGYSLCLGHAKLVGFSKEVENRIRKHWEEEKREAKRAEEIERKTVT